MKKVSDEILINSYSRTGNVWKTGVEVGMCGQSVYERLLKLGVMKRMNLWTEDDNSVLRERYLRCKFENRLDELAKELGRTKQFICRKARALGLTDAKKKVMSEESRRKVGEATRKWISENGHPKGMLGHSHSDSTKARLSESSVHMWADPNSYVNSSENRQRLSDLLHDRKMRGDIGVFSIRGDHPAIIGGKSYVFKSSWEKEMALRLQSLVDDGEIKGWEYEAEHFNFSDMKRGVRSYCPDFRITCLDGKHLYIEVKGWKMEKSMRRIEMFKERYPDVKFYLVDEHEYDKIISESDYLRRRCV